MHTLILAAALLLAPQNSGPTTRDIVMDVCLPFVADGTADQAVISRNGLSGLIEDGQGDFRSQRDVYLVRLTASGAAEDGDLRRVCEVQARSSAFAQARDAIADPLVGAGFAPSPGEPEDWPVWTRGGITVSVHQNPGRATIIRASYSSLDAEGL